MKIAIFTYQFSYNYGTILQAVALQYVIKELGHTPINVLYNCHEGQTRWERLITLVKKPKLFVSELYDYFNRDKLSYSFQKEEWFKKTIMEDYEFYQKNVKTTEEWYNIITVGNLCGYDCYMVGSDQTWSPKINQVANCFMLDKFSNRAKKISYAPSLGAGKLSKYYLSFLKKKLQSFSNISCRDVSNSEVLSKLLRREVVNVVDPTMLLSSEDWKKFEETPSIDISDKYLLLYSLGERADIIEQINKLESIQGYKVYTIVTRPCYRNSKNPLYEINPGKFLWLIRNASLVLTDSYHCVLFSIKYHVNFYAFNKRLEGGDNARIGELLSKLNLSNRLVKNIFEDLHKECSVDYSKVDKIFSEMIYLSKDYLIECLN